jgi:uncharacterized protein (TIGR02588 family)
VSPREAAGSSNGPPLAERIIGALSAAVILGLMVFLGARALANNGTPPDIVVELRGVTQVGAGWLVEVEATNLGSSAATDLEIEGEMPAPGGSERRSVVLEYVPPRSSRRGGLYFTGDPRTRPLTLRALGYRSP